MPEFTAGMEDDDILMITADHGCDPGDNSTDHTREMVPLIIYGKNVTPVNLGTIEGFATIGATAADLLGVAYNGEGVSLNGKI